MVFAGGDAGRLGIADAGERYDGRSGASDRDRAPPVSETLVTVVDD
jgi:hypothetical protein